MTVHNETIVLTAGSESSKFQPSQSPITRWSSRGEILCEIYRESGRRNPAENKLQRVLKGLRNRCRTRKWPLADLWFWEAYNDLFLQHNNLISSIKNKPLQSWRKIKKVPDVPIRQPVWRDLTVWLWAHQKKNTVHRLNTATQPSPVPPPDPRPPSHALVSRVAVVKNTGRPSLVVKWQEIQQVRTSPPNSGSRTSKQGHSDLVLICGSDTLCLYHFFIFYSLSVYAVAQAASTLWSMNPSQWRQAKWRNLQLWLCW